MSEVFVELLRKKLAGHGSVLFLILARDANTLPRLDLCHFSDKAVSLLAALALELETVPPGESGASKAVVMANDIVNADSDGCTAGSDIHYDPARLGLGHANCLLG